MSKNNEYTVDGFFVGANQTRSFDSGFAVREFDLKTEDEKYQEEIKFELFRAKDGSRDNTTIVDAFTPGQKLRVFFSIRGKRLADGRLFNSNKAWKIEPLQGGTAAPAAAAPAAASPAQPAAAPAAAGQAGSGDVPF